MNTKILAMFPGQGSQYVGMGRELFQEFPQISKDTFEQASDSAHLNIKKLCLDGPESELKLTAFTQPCILTLSIAIWRILQKEIGLQPDYYAGHSLGEYSALVAADIIDFSKAVWVVHERGKAMQSAVPAGVGAMAAIMNIEESELESACQAMSDHQNCVEIANYNSPQQIVVAGHKMAVDRLIGWLEEKKYRCVPLAVSAPFHSSLMKPASESMAPILKELNFKEGPHKIIANLTGKEVDSYHADYLIKQIDHPVRWTQSLKTAWDLGCRTYIEIGPGRVLTGLARKTLPRDGLNIMATENLKEAIKTFAG